jgi:hypothetical protein
MPANAESHLRPGAVERVFGRGLAALVRVGLVRGHFYVLEDRGRKSGRTFTLPVDPIEFEGRRYLGALAATPIGCAVPEAVLIRAMRRRRYAVREVPPSMRPPILKASRPLRR